MAALTTLTGEGSAAARTEALLESEDRFVPVAQAGGELVGYAEAQYYGPALRRSFGVARMHDLFVLPAWRRRGVGTALVDAVQQWAQARPSCRFLEWQAGAEAVAFYEARGLRGDRVGDYPDYPQFEIEF